MKSSGKGIADLVLILMINSIHPTPLEEGYKSCLVFVREIRLLHLFLAEHCTECLCNPYIFKVFAFWEASSKVICV